MSTTSAAPPRRPASCYARYRAAARRFEAAGAAIFAAGLACNAAFKEFARWPGPLAMGIGVCVWALGAASLRPHNEVKAFAMQCLECPDAEHAQGLLDALEARKKVRLTPASSRLVGKAVLAYACAESADRELAERLAKAVSDRVANKPF